MCIKSVCARVCVCVCMWCMHVCMSVRVCVSMGASVADVSLMKDATERYGEAATP